uniref:Uncharacterized protein n=1 Tax=Arundo donax TaxID=35708 RepID=A0A0A9GDJ3_ARUDO
MVVGCGPPNK